MILTAHIPLPDPARGRVWFRLHIDKWGTAELYQYGFSNTTVLGEVHETVAEHAVIELNLRMRVYKELTC